MCLKPTYASSIEYVEQDNQNNGQEEKEDGETKQTCRNTRHIMTLAGHLLLQQNSYRYINTLWRKTEQHKRLAAHCSF